ncbi:MAG: clan AA aspartic protease [Bacteroidetes bacterium]|nr:clan AA aspartic protease [Bacteroidota bacterium]
MKSIIPIRLIKLDDGFHIFVSAKINRKKASLIIDTGASRSAFDKERIKKFVDKNKFEKHEKLASGIGTNSMKSQITMLDKFQIGKIKLKDYFAILLDFSHVVAAYKQMGVKPIDGVLGSDILKSYNAVIDYGKKKLILTISHS